MAINNITVGRDYYIGFFDADTNQMIDLGDVQNVKINAQKHDVKSMPYNDVPRFGGIPDGYKVAFTVVRTGPDLENFQLAANTRFNAGSSTKAGFLNETVTNPDGSVSRYQYTGFVFWVSDIGEISREKPVQMQAEGYASDKVALA
jgi:hypothetical protein